MCAAILLAWLDDAGPREDRGRGVWAAEAGCGRPRWRRVGAAALAPRGAAAAGTRGRAMPGRGAGGGRVWADALATRGTAAAGTRLGCVG